MQAIEQHLMTFDAHGEHHEAVRASGACYWDENGKKYVNLNDISCVLGYMHPAFTKAVSDAVMTKCLGHLGDYSKDKAQLIEHLIEAANHDFSKVFLAGIGGEVVDWSVKIARRYTGRDGIVSFRNALHGRSFAGAFLSGVDRRKAGFGTGLSNVTFWEYGKKNEESLSDVAAVIIEPYQALGGMVSPDLEYWKWLRDYTKENGVLLIVDEIQTGFGKTGSFFAYQESGIVPDMILCGKGMSNGFGMAALMTTDEIAASVKPHELSGGSADNDLLCSISNIVFEIMKKDQIVEHVAALGAFAKNELERIATFFGEGYKVHGKGLFLGMEMPEGKAAGVVAACKRNGICFGCSGNHLLMRPPLVITEDEITEALAILQSNMKDIVEEFER